VSQRVRVDSLARRLDAAARALLARRFGWLALYAAANALLLALYAPALHGEFVSDDVGFVVHNPWVREPSAAHVLEILDPWGDAAAFAINWAPVHLLIHAAQWRAFGASTLGYHVTNVALHALASVLLVAIYRRSRLPPLAALGGGAFFLLHPANVEAVAWISEVKTLAAMALALGALLLQFRRPGLAAALFAAALLSKALAVFALPVAIVAAGLRRARGTAARRDAAWLLVWLAFFAFYAAPQWHVFQQHGETDLGLHPDPLVAARSVVAFVARYLAMGSFGIGLSAFHDPPRALSWLDPWWLVGLAALGLFALRAVRAALRRDEEALYWAWALGGWIPISQIFPFTYPLGDRYLYFPLPGLVGAALLAGCAAWPRVRAGLAAHVPRAADAVLAAALVLLASFAVRVPARAEVWRAEALLMHDAARHYPNGIQSHLLSAMRAGEQGDADAAAAALSRAREKGFDLFFALDQVGAFDLIRRDPRFVSAKAEIAGFWLARHRALREPNQAQLRVAALAHLARGERVEALAALERARARGGPFQADVESRLESLRREPGP
jgi:hypothetical protein